MAGFALSMPLFFVTTGAWLLWFVAPALAGLAGRLRNRKRGNDRGAGASQAPAAIRA